MGDGIFFIRSHFRRGTVIARRAKNRVIAETVLPGGFPLDIPFAFAARINTVPVGKSAADT